MNCILLSLFLFSLSVHCATLPLQVSTIYGPVVGQYTQDNLVREFLGIPYAAPPVGALRWKPTQPPSPWSEPLTCTSFGYSCPQLPSAIFTAFANEELSNDSEDCLTLNVWTPSSSTGTELLPVMVFIYGGGFQAGSSADIMIEGYNYAKDFNTIVVTFNYRLGCLGFLGASQFTLENSSLPTTGNWGVFDQQMALRWVQENIYNFGGDKSRVMVFGESAGGNSIFNLLTSELSAGLFTRAGIESGYYHGLLPLATAEEMGDYTIHALGCDIYSNPSDITECLRNVPVSVILNSTQNCFYQPTIDNVQFTQQPNQAVLAGDFERVPLLLGANHNELAIYVLTGIPKNITAEQYSFYFTLLWNAFNLPKSQKQNAMNLYPLEDFYSPFWALVAAFTDWNFKCSNRRFAKWYQEQGEDSYLFQFSYPPDNNGYWNYDGFMDVYHTAELQFVFRTWTNFSHTPANATSWGMMEYWSTFANAGNPNPPSSQLPLWPSYTYSADTNINIFYPMSTQVGMGNATRCNFWDTVPDYTAGAATCTLQ